MSSPAPRWGSQRSTRPTHGALLAAVAELIGWKFHPWQRYAADVALEYEPRTKIPRFRQVGIGLARQNGKTTLVCARVAMQLIIPRQTVVYTAQDRNMARFKWTEHVELLMSTPFADKVRRVGRVNGSEALYMHNGSQYLIVTPDERKAGRSMSVDLAVIDEAFAQESLGLIGAINPTMSARPRAQMWVLSNAGTIRSILWRHLTEMGRAEADDPDSPMCWLEWAAADDADPADRRAWAQANPTLDLPHGVLTTALQADLLAGDSDTFLREHLNVWVDVSQLIGIDPLTWAACRDDDIVVGREICLALDFTPERDRGALVACGEIGGRTPIEVIEHTSDLERLVTRCAKIASDWRATVVIDRGGPAASAIAALERARVKVRLIALPDFVRACGDFHDAAVHAQLAHRGDYRLTDAVAGATKRQVADAWAWRRRGGADITPLVAATLARWGIVSTPPPMRPAIF